MTAPGALRRRAVIVLVAVGASVLLPGLVPAAAAEAARTQQQPYAKIISLAIADIQDFWSTTMPDVYGQAYRRIPASRIYPYTSTTKIPQCGTKHATYKDVKGNAFYCSLGAFVAYDDQTLFPDLYKKFGDFTLALALAHEWGHAIQDQTGTSGPTIDMEQQADCFAGAWVAHVDAGESTRLSLQPGNLDTALGGFLELRDPPGNDPTAEGAHGSAFDRIGAFQDGFNGGARACARYVDDPPALVEIPFSSKKEAASRGNLPFRDVVPATLADLDKYWSSLFSNYVAVDGLVTFDPRGKIPSCGPDHFTRAEAQGLIYYCSGTNQIVADKNLLLGVYRKSGDFGVAVIVAIESSVAIQSQFGETGTEKALALERACLAGSWAGSVARGEHDPDGTSFTLSSGDLDEAIQAFLIFEAPDAAKTGTRPTAFESLASFRSGFFDGEQPCVTIDGIDQKR
jgi:predicted metalloprotease